MKARAVRTGDAIARPAEKQADDAATGRRPLLDAAPTPGTAPVPGAGEPLAEPVRALFEARYGQPLDGVRVHRGPAATRAADERFAHGYTVGDHVVVGSEDDDLLAHELAHAAQQRRTGRVGVQHDDAPRTGGLGRKPPAVDYDVARAPAPREDLHVLFPGDSAELPDLALAGVLPLLPASSGTGTVQPVRVDVDGYSSREGDAEYNLNLSAHRAAAIRSALLLVLPPGSEVLLHAHGETGVFGAEAAPNRRAGLRVTAITSRLPVPPPTLFPPKRRPSLVPELELEIDPSLIRPWRPGDPAELGTPSPYRPVVPPLTAPPLTVPPLVPPIGPVPGVPFRPWLFPGLVPRRPAVDWAGIRQGVLSHGGLTIDPKLADSIKVTVDAEYDRYRGLGFTHDQAESLANLAVSSELSRQLAREGNTAIDRSNKELAERGVTTTIVPIITPAVIEEFRRRIFGGGR